jgi:hypothetical protein
MMVTCARCGRQSEIGEEFLSSDNSDNIFYCPKCDEEKSISYAQSFLIASVIVFFCGSLWLIFDSQNELALRIFQAGLIGVFWPVVVFFHELGHAIAAFLLKFKVLGITIGEGKTLFHFNFLWIKWKICIFPVCGTTHISTINPKFYRLRSLLIFFGGPFANFIILFFCIIILFTTSSSWITSIIIPFTGASCFMLIQALNPKKYNLGKRKAYSDGLQMLNIPFKSKTQIQEEIESYCIREAYDYIQKGFPEEAKKILENGLAQFPESLKIKEYYEEIRWRS